MLTKTQTLTKSPTDCERCGGNGWVTPDLPKRHPDYGKAIRCEACTDWLAHSRLTDEERQHKLADIANRPDDTRGEIFVLRFLGKAMLDDPFGFLSIYGHRGGGKSLLLTALVAEFCRATSGTGRAAVYFNSGDVVTLLNAGEREEIDGFRVIGNYEAAKKRLKAIPVLAIDEMDKIRWTPWQIQQIGEVIEHRHRNAAELVTIFAMNRPPWEWSNAGDVEHIASRFRDGRFHRKWPDGVKKPAYLNGSNDVPGLFEATLPDIRPTLRRQAPTV